MRADDLTPLLQQSGRPDLGYRQGTIEAWDATAGTNTVNVAGTLLANLPILGALDAMSMQAGDVVGVLRVRSQYFILGRIAAPDVSSDVTIRDGELLAIDSLNDRWVAIRNGKVEFGRISDGVNNALSQIRAQNQDLEAIANFNAFLIGENQALVDSPSGNSFLNAALDIGLDAGSGVFITTGDIFDVVAGNQIDIDATGQIVIEAGTDLFVSHTTTGNSPNAFIGTSSPGAIQRSTSSRRYKTDIRDYHVAPRTVLDLQPRTWRDRAEVEANPDTDRWHVGLIAEEVEQAGLSAFVNYDHEGRPDYISYDRLCVALLEVVKDQDRRLEALEARAAALDGQTAPKLAATPTKLPKRRMDPPVQRPTSRRPEPRRPREEH